MNQFVNVSSVSGVGGAASANDTMSSDSGMGGAAQGGGINVVNGTLRVAPHMSVASGDSHAAQLSPPILEQEPEDSSMQNED